MTRNRWILGISVIVALLLILSGLALFREWKDRQARVERRVPLQALGYCTEDQVTPCILSFSLDSDDQMLVSFLTAGAFYPDFYLKVKTEKSEHIYVCQKVSTFATSVYCTGQELPIGIQYQFLIYSLNEDILLAQGSFPIIGMALGTPHVFAPPTETPTLTIPTPGVTPQRTRTPSYPSYP